MSRHLWQGALPVLLLGLSALPQARTALAKDGYSDAEIRAVETADEGKIRELRQQEITQLRITLGRHQPAARQADLYLRLAEIYLEEYRTQYLLEGRVHDKRLEAGKPENFIDHARSRPQLINGIKACQEILRFNIPYAKLDQVYYFLGYNFGELGDKKESVKHYAALIQRFPSSAYASEAYREMGDSAFAEAQYRKAIPYYEKAVQKRSGENLPRIQHRLAWCYYRIKQYEQAVDMMKQAIAGAQKSGEKFMGLREEALRDMAIFMTESGKVDEAITYFQAVAGDKAFYPKALERLGKQYERNVEPQKAIQVYESLLKTHPESEAAFRVLAKLVDLDIRRGHFKEAVDRIQNLQPPAAGATKDEETHVAALNLRAMIRRTATEHHEKFRKENNRAALEIAELYYTTYWKVFLSKEDPRQEKPEIQMYLAEVKRELGKSREASELYRKVVDSRDKRYAKEAGALWTASLGEAIKKDQSAGKNGKSDEPSELEKEFISASDALQEALSEAPEGREAALRAAEVYAGYKNTQKEAIKRARKIIDKWPRTTQAVTAARLWLQIVGDRLPPAGATGQESSDASRAADDLKDILKELRENSGLLAADQESGKGKLRAAMTELETRLKIHAIARSEKDKNYPAAAKGYEAFARESSQPEVAERAYASAMSNYIKAGDSEGTERVTVDWLKRFPKSGKANDAFRGAATQFLILGNFEASARLFEKLGLEGDATSLETAARIYEGNGDSVHAVQDWTAFLDKMKSAAPAQRAAVALVLARTQEVGQRESEASKAYKECVATGSALEAECGFRLAELYYHARNVSEAKANFRKVGAIASRPHSGALSPYVGFARYRLAVLMEEEARFEPLQFPDAKLKVALNQRLEFLEPLSRAYNSAVEAGGPWAVAALDRLAQWALKFADEVDQISPPAGADSGAVATLKKNLASISGSLRKKALQTFSDAYAKSASAEALSPVIPELADRLVDLKAPGMGRAQGARGKFRLAGIPADGGSDSRSTALEKVRDKLQKNAQDSAAWSDYGNLIWGLGKPLLAKLAYDRALTLNAKNVQALNNRAVVALSTETGGEEDGLVAMDALGLFSEALKQDDFFLPAKFNRALLLNYYRIFSKARPLWEQILAKNTNLDSQDGLAAALQGLGHFDEADAAFKKARELGGSNSRFAAVYHEAARTAQAGASGAVGCLSRLADADLSSLAGFERNAWERLKKGCTQWKSDK